MSEFETARQNMVDGQLRPTKVTDNRVLDVMGALPREMFVEKSRQGIAYVDEDIEVAPGRYLMEPVVLARLVQALDLTAADSVLVIGAATGYDSALIGRIAGPVVAVESASELADQASMVINHLGIDNVAVVVGALERGYAEQAPYDVVFFCGAIDDVPGDIVRQLSPNGRMVAVIGGAENGVLGRACLMTRSGESLSKRALFDAGTRPLPGFAKEAAFVF
ncbi:MAG: protein-L-isoaspartate O-methyltransferase [Alphaproteobacteria bacterium]|jgi:protein-L-isoaspartate(D-aspartate) O-methyltransferase|nr:protein-L-isoaspartate O-methyltransferase [Alphaproteobacteria bacterium]